MRLARHLLAQRLSFGHALPDRGANRREIVAAPFSKSLLSFAHGSMASPDWRLAAVRRVSRSVFLRVASRRHVATVLRRRAQVNGGPAPHQRSLFTVSCRREPREL